MNEPARDIPGVIAFPPFLYAIPWLIGLGVQALFPVHLPAPGSARAAGIVLTALAISFAGWARWAMYRAGTDPNPGKPSAALALIGPYRVTRNPMYLSLAIFYVGLTLVMNTVWPLVLLPGVLLVVQRGVIEREERYLTARFGDAYRDYCARVRRWL